MTETSSYPEREHYNQPSSFLDVLQDELMYAQGDGELKKDIEGLKKIYEAWPLYNCFDQYADVMEMADLNTGRNNLRIHHERIGLVELDDDPMTYGTNIHFLDGAVLAMHCALRPMSSSERKMVLYQNPYQEFANNTPQDFQNGIVNTTIAEELGDFVGGNWQYLLLEQEHDFQALTIMAGEQMYGQSGTQYEEYESFMAGFMFSCTLISFLFNKTKEEPVDIPDTSIPVL